MAKFNRRYSIYLVSFCAIMLALQIVFSRFLKIDTGVIRFSFGFVPVMLVSVYYGIPASIAVWALSDVLGSVLFPSGAYFPGFTLTAALMGLCCGFFMKNLYEIRSLRALARIAVCVFINQFILSLFLNTFWLTIIIGKGFGALFVSRLISSSVDFVVQTGTMFILYKTGFLRLLGNRIVRN